MGWHYAFLRARHIFCCHLSIPHTLCGSVAKLNGVAAGKERHLPLYLSAFTFNLPAHPLHLPHASHLPPPQPFPYHDMEGKAAAAKAAGICP